MLTFTSIGGKQPTIHHGAKTQNIIIILTP
jgi:hypothetical protein